VDKNTDDPVVFYAEAVALMTPLPSHEIRQLVATLIDIYGSYANHTDYEVGAGQNPCLQDCNSDALEPSRQMCNG